MPGGCADGLAIGHWNCAVPAPTTCSAFVCGAAKPGRATRSIGSSNAEELTRWRNDSHRSPPYQYKDENTIYDNRKRRRVVADTLLRETFMLFREDHTHAGVTRAEQAKGPMVERDLRDSWIGNSMHC